MLKDCIQIFEEQKKSEGGGNLIFDNWGLSQGDYILVNLDKDFEEEIIEIRKLKRDEESLSIPHYELLQRLDYFSRYMESNKCIPVSEKVVENGKSKTKPVRKIHSNQLLSFTTNKKSVEGISKENIEMYYELTFKMATEEFQEEIEGKKNKITKWVQENLSRWGSKGKEDSEDKVKIFFIFNEKEKTLEKYEEGLKQYLFTDNRIYSDSGYTFSEKETVYGPPPGNTTLNAKKPFLLMRSRKKNLPLAISIEDAYSEWEFFNFLKAVTSQKIFWLYFDTRRREILFVKDNEVPTDDISGLFVGIRSETTGPVIHYMDAVPSYRKTLPQKFIFQDYFGELLLRKEKNKEQTPVQYGDVYQRGELFFLINSIFFHGKIFYDDVKKSSPALKFGITTCRNKMIDFAFRGVDENLLPVLEKAASLLIKEAIVEGNIFSVKRKLNLLYSLRDYYKNEKKGETIVMLYKNLLEKAKKEEDWEFSSDEEYFFSVGQVVSYMLSQKRSSSRSAAMPEAIAFFNQKKDEKIKQRLGALYKKYAHSEWLSGKRFKNVFGKIMEYKPQSSINSEMILSGYTQNNVFFEKREDKINE